MAQNVVLIIVREAENAAEKATFRQIKKEATKNNKNKLASFGGTPQKSGSRTHPDPAAGQGVQARVQANAGRRNQACAGKGRAFVEEGLMPYLPERASLCPDAYQSPWGYLVSRISRKCGRYG